MKQYPTNINASNVVNAVQDIAALRSEDIEDYNNLRDGKLKGRNRTGVREVPTSPSDVVASDIEGDVVINATHRFTFTGTAWDRQTLNVSW